MSFAERIENERIDPKHACYLSNLHGKIRPTQKTTKNKRELGGLDTKRLDDVVRCFFDASAGLSALG